MLNKKILSACLLSAVLAAPAFAQTPPPPPNPNVNQLDQNTYQNRQNIQQNHPVEGGVRERRAG